MTDPWGVVGILKRYEFRFSSEAELQNGVGEVLEKNGIFYAREYSLTERDRIDFYLPAGIGLEVKIDGSGNDLLRQCSRYLQLPQLHALVVVAAGHRLASAIPSTLCGKPLAVINVRASL